MYDKLSQLPLSREELLPELGSLCDDVHDGMAVHDALVLREHLP